jgi:hypothetical protein
MVGSIKKIPRITSGDGKNRLEPMKNKIFANPFLGNRKRVMTLRYVEGLLRVGEADNSLKGFGMQ